MTNYAKIIYPPDEGNPYPKKLAKHIVTNYFVSNGTPNQKLLDVGCSSGTWLNCFRQMAQFDLHGIDLRDEHVDNIVFKPCDLEKERIPFDDNTFDFIFSKSVIEHVFNTDNFISEVYRVLKPGGVVVIMTPDWVSCMDVFWDDYTHVRAFSRKSLRDAFIIHGFDKVDCEHFYQLPFVWRHRWLRVIPWLISFLPNFLKWKDREHRNTKDRKLIRFSIEKMLLVTGTKK